MSTFLVQVSVSTVIEFPVEAGSVDGAIKKGRELFEEDEELQEIASRDVVPQEIRAYNDIAQTEWESF